MTNQEPKKHHYIPCFYLKRWCSRTDGRLCELSRPYGERVRPKRVSPAGTGYVNRLYTMRGFPEEHAHQLEERFFRPADGQAHEALCKLEVGGRNVQWTVEQRSAWSRFMMSLLLRCPEDIDNIRYYWRDVLIDEIDLTTEVEYTQLREPDDPSTFKEFLQNQRQAVMEEGLFDTLLMVMDSQEMGSFINSLDWKVLDVSSSPFDLLTSDRPVYQPVALEDPRGCILLPIGPTRLFVAAKSSQIFDILRTKRVQDVVASVNRATVGAAARFVYGSSDAQLGFVQKWFGKTPQPRLLDQAIRLGTERRLRAKATSARTCSPARPWSPVTSRSTGHC